MRVPFAEGLRARIQANREKREFGRFQQQTNERIDRWTVANAAAGGLIGSLEAEVAKARQAMQQYKATGNRSDLVRATVPVESSVGVLINALGDVLRDAAPQQSSRKGHRRRHPVVS